MLAVGRPWLVLITLLCHSSPQQEVKGREKIRWKKREYLNVKEAFSQTAAHLIHSNILLFKNKENTFPLFREKLFP